MTIKMQLMAECELCPNNIMYWGIFSSSTSMFGVFPGGNPEFEPPENWKRIEFIDPETKKFEFSKLGCSDCCTKYAGKEVITPEEVEEIHERQRVRNG